MWSSEDIHYMEMAVDLAGRGEGQVSPNPMVGAVIVKDGRVISEGWHRAYGGLHAETDALASCTESPAGATMYVTLEPCAMCAGLIAHARISRVVFGARDEKTGAYGGVFDLQTTAKLNHRVQVDSGVCAKEAAALLTEFFGGKRHA